MRPFVNMYVATLRQSVLSRGARRARAPAAPVPAAEIAQPMGVPMNVDDVRHVAPTDSESVAGGMNINNL